ncbi:MAG: hypothetical protein ACRDBQ_00015, partial [Shewanella sp.]
NTTSRVEDTRKASSVLHYRTWLKRLDKDPLLIISYCFGCGAYQRAGRQNVVPMQGYVRTTMALVHKLRNFRFLYSPSRRANAMASLYL